MARWVRIFSPLFVTSLVAFFGSVLGLVFLRATVLACTVGFNTSSQPLSAGQAAQCPSYEIASAVLVAAGLVAGALLIWLGVRFFKANSAGSPEKEGSDLGQGTASRASRSRLFSRLLAWPTYRWVCLLVAAFFVASFFAASLQYSQGLVDTNDLAINQQALSSTLLGGKPYPFYEALNCGRHGQCSFLQVHQAFVAYGVALVYGVAPTPFTLFAIQSLALGIAALPLYALAVDVIGSRRLSFVVAGAYLVWVPLFMMAARDSFHWEAFIPVEMLTVFWLWNRQRYLLALPIVLLAFVTLEVTPILAFFVGLYFVWPWLIQALRLFSRAVFGRSVSTIGTPSKFRLWSRWIRKSLQVPEVYASLALMAGSVAAYVLLRLFVLDGGWLLGLPPVPPAYALPLSSPNKDFVLSFATVSTTWWPKLVFWIVIYVTLGFIPLFAPRTLLLVLPWIAFTVFNTDVSFWQFGDQYVFVPAAALLIGFTFGLNRLNLWMSAKPPRSTATPSTSGDSPGNGPDEVRNVRSSPRGQWTPDGLTASGSSRAAGFLTIGVVVIIAGNLLLNPLSPLAASIAPDLGHPFTRSYEINFASPPNDQALQQLISMIPKNAVVTAPKTVYSLVADDPYAYPMVYFTNPPYNVTLLPDNESNRLEYVLLPYNTPTDEFTSALQQTLYDRSAFGVRSCVLDSAAGGVELFQRNYTGAAETFGPADPLCPNYFSGGDGLSVGENATFAVNSTSPSGGVIASVPCAANGSTVWTGPGIELPSGTFTFEVVYSVYNSGDPACKNPLVKNYWKPLIMNVTGENTSGIVRIAHHYFTVSECIPTCGPWHYWNDTITLQSPISEFSFTGTVTVGEYVVQVALVLVSPVES